MIVHELKTWPTYFRPLWDREKTFEIRFDDRGFQRGDMANLREWDRDLDCTCRRANHDTTTCTRYTGRRILAEIGYVTAATSARGQQPGFEGRGYVVFSLINVEALTEDLEAVRRDGALAPGRFVDAMTCTHPTPAAMPQHIPAQRSP